MENRNKTRSKSNRYRPTRRRPRSLQEFHRWGLPKAPSATVRLPKRPLQAARRLLRLTPGSPEWEGAEVELSIAVAMVSSAADARKNGPRDGFILVRLKELYWAAEDLRDLLLSLDAQSHRYLRDQGAFERSEELERRLRGLTDVEHDGAELTKSQPDLITFLSHLANSSKKASEAIVDKGGVNRRLMFSDPEAEAGWWAWSIYQRAMEARHFNFSRRKCADLASLIWEMALGEEERDFMDAVAAAENQSK